MPRAKPTPATSIPAEDPDWAKLESAGPPPGRPVLDSLAPAYSVNRVKAKRLPGWAISTRSPDALAELKKRAQTQWNAQGNYLWVGAWDEDKLREIFANFDELKAKAPKSRLL